MTTDDFRRTALSLEGAEESSHMGQPDFRVGGRIFATLASAHQGYGNLMLTPEQQAVFVEELARGFRSHRGWVGTDGNDPYPAGRGERGHAGGALHAAWKLRVEKNAKSGKKKDTPTQRGRAAKSQRKKR